MLSLCHCFFPVSLPLSLSLALPLPVSLSLSLSFALSLSALVCSDLTESHMASIVCVSRCEGGRPGARKRFHAGHAPVKPTKSQGPTALDPKGSTQPQNAVPQPRNPMPSARRIRFWPERRSGLPICLSSCTVSTPFLCSLYVLGVTYM